MTKLEEVARAIQTELRRQGVLYPLPPEEPDPRKLMMCTGEVADLPAVVRAALTALRIPNAAMVEAAYAECYPGDTPAIDDRYTAMIDAILTSSDAKQSGSK